MRLIERKMIAAIYEHKDWKCDNTHVICTQFVHSDEVIDRVSVILHGSTIAVITPTEVQMSDCGWQTPTTKSRLNAILREFCNAGVYQKNRKWYVTVENAEDKQMQRNSNHFIPRR